MYQPALRPKNRHFRTLRTIGALILREMSTTYGKSVMGYLWALVEPIAALTLMSVVFSLFLRQPALGTSFPLFFASGFLIFQIYAGVGNKVATSIQFSRQLLEFPAVTALDAVLARFILNFATQLIVIFIMISGLILYFDLRVYLDIGAILTALGMAGLFTLGIGTFNSYLFIAYPAYQTIWAIANRPMFILSGIFFMFDDVPQPFRDLLWFNPIIHIVGQMRVGIYATYEGNYVSIAYVCALGLGLFAAGILILRRFLRQALIK